MHLQTVMIFALIGRLSGATPGWLVLKSKLLVIEVAVFLQPDTVPIA